MKKNIFFLVLFCLTISSSHAAWYGGSVWSGVLNGSHTQGFSYGSNTWCNDDNDGITGSTEMRVLNVTTNAPGSGTMQCQRWDAQAPINSVSRGSQTWINGNIPVTIDYEDRGGSGLATIRYDTTGATSNSLNTSTSGRTQSRTITFTQEGSHSILVRSTDRVGLTDSDTYGPYQIDKNPPTGPSLFSSSHSNENTWYSNGTVQMNINMIGEGPSPAENLWCIATTTTCTPNQSIGASESVSVSPGDGIWYFRAMTRDVGGTGPIRSFRVQIDTTDPGSQTASQTAYPGGTNWSNTNTSINLNVSDANGGAQVSGIANAYYRWSTGGTSACSGGVRFDGGPGQVTVSGNTNTSEIVEDGSYRLTLCSIDGTDVGNVSESNFGDYRMDRNAPAAPTISVSNGLGNISNGNWTTNAATRVTVNESTTGSFNQRVGPSPHTTLFCRSRTGPCTPTAGGLGFGTETLQDGVRHFAAQSRDTGGNSPITRYSISIDTEAPIHNANPANRLNWSAVSTLNIALTSSDPQKDGSNSGVQRSRYIVNQNTTSPFDGACSGGTGVPGTYTNFAEGTNYIHICSIDVAGNINTSTTDTFGYYLVDLTDPVITDNYGANDGIWQNTAQTITLTSLDAHSGTRYVRYCLGALCTPTTLLGGEVSAVGVNTVTRSLTFPAAPPIDTILRYQSFDYAGRTSIISERSIKIENEAPTSIGTVNYHGSWDNNTIPSQLVINFRLNDTGGSQFERVQIQYRRAPLDGNGGYGPFGAWGDAPGGNFTGLSGTSYSTPYNFRFQNGRAVQFRVQYYDEAGNQGIDFIGTSTLLMDETPPTVFDNHPAARDGVWQNSPITVTFNGNDIGSGVPNGSFEYCTGVECIPSTPWGSLSETRTFDSVTDVIYRYRAIDRAGNESAINEIEIRIESIPPTATIDYHNGWENNDDPTNRIIRYRITDTGGSGVENVTLQRAECPLTGACNPLESSWNDARAPHTAQNGNFRPYSWPQPFEDDVSYKYRVIYSDEAGNNGIPVVGTSILRMDRMDPSSGITYSGTSGTWYNTTQTLTFGASDNYSLVRTARYCEVPFNTTPCDPFSTSGADFPVSEDYDPVTGISVYVGVIDNADNESSIQRFDVLVEDEMPTAPMQYYNGRRDDSTGSIPIIYVANDTGGSQLERVTLERRTAPTNNNNTLGTWTGWTTAPATPSGDPIQDYAGLDQDQLIGIYRQQFINRTAVQYRVRLEDEADNIQYAYVTYGAPEIGTMAYEKDPADIPAEVSTLRMENEDADATITNNDINISPNGWTNVTSQGIDIDFSDTGGSLLQSYTLQVSDVIDTSSPPTFANLGAPTTWANVVGHTNIAITGENDTSTYTFTGVNKHAYMFRVMVTDIAGNSSIWIESTDTPIKIDTDTPDASDVSSITDTDLMASSAQNFIVDFDNNSGSPIIEANATFEDWSTTNTFLTTIDSSTSDNNPGVANQLDINHSIQDVDRDREPDPAGYRGYGYRITRIEDEAGNIAYIPSGSGIVTYGYRVYANSFVASIGTRSLNNVASVTTTANIADGTEDRLIAEVRDSYGNAYVRASGIGREINFNFVPTSNLFIDQYTRAGAGSVEMSTSNTPGWIDLGLLNNSNLTDLDYIPTNDGEYAFDFRAYTPTENAYPTTTSVSDPGAEFVIENFQFAVQHTPPNPLWDTGDQSLDNGALIDFVYSPLFTTAITGDIEDFGFIEGANQDSDITIQKANSTVNPNAESLVLEFGVNDRDPTPEMKLETYPGPRTTPEGYNDSRTEIYETFNLNTPNSSFPFPIDSLLIMERGFELLERQERYLSTHIRYNLDGKDIKYNSDIIGKDNYYGNGLGNNTIQTGLKVLGQTHSGKQKDIIIDQEGKDLRVIGDIYKASLKKDIVKNAFTIIRNADPNWTFGGTSPEITDLTDFTPEVNDGKSLFNNNVLYFGDDGTNARVDINTSNTRARISGKKTILAYGRDIYIESDMYYNNSDEDILGIIALTDDAGLGGNIYIKPSVTNIVGTMFAEKSVMSFDGFDELGGGTDQETLKHQLHIYGSVFSENTIGGSRSVVLACPYYILDSDCDQDTAQKYDLNYLRRYFTYRNGTFIVPANDGKAIGGGDCDTTGDCDNWESYYARYITNTDPAIDTESGRYAVYPVVIEYNPTGQTSPAPLFEAQ